MTSLSKDIKIIKGQSEMNALFAGLGAEAAYEDCDEERPLIEEFDPASHETIKKELIEKYRVGKLVAVWFRYTRRDGKQRISAKMLLLDGVRHCS